MHETSPAGQPDVSFGIEVFPAAGTPKSAGDGQAPLPPWMEYSSNRVTRAMTRPFVIVGEAAVDATIGLLAGSIGRVVHGVVTDFETRRTTDDALPPLKSIELTFAIKLTGGAGDVVKAFVTAGGEASVQVKVVVEPTPRS